MYSYQIKLENDVLKVGFTTPTDGDLVRDEALCDRIVKDIHQQIKLMIDSGELTGGKLLKIKGRISVLGSYTLAHEIAHLFSAISQRLPLSDRCF